MIQRVLIKNQLSFKQVDLEFSEGLIAFTGPSGAGKSVFMQALLSLFGFSEANASLVEAEIQANISLEQFGIESEEVNVFKLVKEKSTRYFVNLQSVSKKNMSTISSEFVSYLSVKDENEFESDRLISLLDVLATKDKKTHQEDVLEFRKLYVKYLEEKSKLDEIEEKEKKVEELKEFTRFEIEKINEISPKIGEDKELMEFKRSLSKKEKIEEAIDKANTIFNYEDEVTQVLSLLEKESSFFDEAMNELRGLFEEEKERLNDLEDIDVESLLDRIEKISNLKKRHGEIEDILAYKAQKESELQEYEEITFIKDNLVKNCKQMLQSLKEKAEIISKRRKEKVLLLNEKINNYLKLLYMPHVTLLFEQIQMSETGEDALSVELGKVNVKKISSGEYNRLRLAFIATSTDLLKTGRGVLFLDEIDANLSGKESMSVANVLKELSKRYQIFAISHQPQLSSQAHMHFFVTKEDNVSKVKYLEKEDRIVELARMVSGTDVSQEAINFAKTLMESSKGK